MWNEKAPLLIVNQSTSICHCPDVRCVGRYLSQLTYSKMRRIAFSPTNAIRLPHRSDLTLILGVTNQSVLSRNYVFREAGPSNGDASHDSCNLWNSGSRTSCRLWTGTRSTWPISSSVTATVPDLESEWRCRGQFKFECTAHVYPLMSGAPSERPIMSQSHLADYVQSACGTSDMSSSYSSLRALWLFWNDMWVLLTCSSSFVVSEVVSH